jgi:taurine dioxygenase
MELLPLEAALGAEVIGLDLATAPDTATMRGLTAALHRHGLLVIRKQDITPRHYEAFGALWGDLLAPLIARLKVDGADFVNMVGNVGPVLETDAFRNGAAFWHTDRTYVADPNAVTMLHAVEAPESGGETMLANLAAAWDALDEGTRAEVAGRHALHRFGAGERDAWEFAVHPMTPEEEVRMPPPARHLLARPHDVTGRVSLYAPAGSWIAVEGLDDDAARSLMRRLKRHATDERFVYRHRWRRGDVILWDNTQTLHAAAPIAPPTGPHDRRLLHRIVATGLPHVPHARRVVA